MLIFGRSAQATRWLICSAISFVEALTGTVDCATVNHRDKLWWVISAQDMSVVQFASCHPVIHFAISQTRIEPQHRAGVCLGLQQARDQVRLEVPELGRVAFGVEPRQEPRRGAELAHQALEESAGAERPVGPLDEVQSQGPRATLDGTDVRRTETGTPPERLLCHAGGTPSPTNLGNDEVGERIWYVSHAQRPNLKIDYSRHHLFGGSSSSSARTPVAPFEPSGLHIRVSPGRRCR